MISPLTYVIIILGIIVCASFVIVTYILHKKQLGIGYWPLFSVAVFSFTLGNFFSSVLDNPQAFDYCFLVGMIVLCFASILKYWEIMRLIE